MPEKERMNEKARLKRKLEADPQDELDRELEREMLRLERESKREGQQLERMLEREMHLLEGKFEQGLQRLKMWARKLQQQRHCSELSKVVEPGLIKPAKGQAGELSRAEESMNAHSHGAAHNHVLGQVRYPKKITRTNQKTNI